MRVEDLINLFREDKTRVSSEFIHIWAVFWLTSKYFSPTGLGL